MRIAPRFPVFTSSQIHPQDPTSALPPASSPNSDSFQRNQVKMSGKAVRFGMLVKISGTGAYQDKKGILHYSLENSLEFAKQYEEEPGEFMLGYYRDPEKPDNVWMADDDAMGIHADKTTLDNARKQSPEEFKNVFNRLKKERGIKNLVRRPNEPIKPEEDRVSKGRFVKITGTGVQTTESGEPAHTLEEALELAGFYKDHPEEWQLGYYQDPEKPDNVWMAEGDAKFLLDRAIRENLPLEFVDAFKMLKKKHGEGVTNKLGRAMSTLSGSNLSQKLRNILN